VIPLPVGLEPVGKHETVRLDGENPAVCAGLKNELATVADDAITELHTIIELPIDFSINWPGAAPGVGKALF